jgi:hypothetical protein
LFVRGHSGRDRFLVRDWDGVKEDSRRHLAETAAALMWPRLVAPDPFIGIRGKFPARKSAIEPWSLSQKAMQWNSFNMVL